MINDKRLDDEKTLSAAWKKTILQSKESEAKTSPRYDEYYMHDIQNTQDYMYIKF